MYTDISLHKTELYLLKKGIKIEDIASFTFMQPYKIRARRCKPYWHNLGGTGIFIFTLQSGFVRAIQLAPFQAHKATAILQLLKQHAIPFTNYQPCRRYQMHRFLPALTTDTPSTCLFPYRVWYGSLFCCYP